MNLTRDDRRTLTDMRAWYERHKHDYDPSVSAPPKAWAEYFGWLLTMMEQGAALPSQEARPDICTPEENNVINADLQRDGDLYVAGYDAGKQWATENRIPPQDEPQENK